MSEAEIFVDQQITETRESQLRTKQQQQLPRQYELQQEQQCQQSYDNKAQDDVAEQPKMLLASKIGQAISSCRI